MPKRFCYKPGCPELVPVGTRFCSHHAGLKWRELDARRGSSSERGYDADWQRFRRYFLSRHPLCSDCQSEGRLSTANEVHHVEKVADNPARRLDSTNCMALCKPCHSIRTKNGE